MILGVPVFQAHALTADMVRSLAETVRDPTFTLVIVDNASPDPYRRAEFDVPFRLRIIRNERNEGNWYPLRQVIELEPCQEVVALAHNDLLYYEPGWDVRVEAAFRADPRLGMVGFAGAAALNRQGERIVTMTNFRGTHGHAAAENIGIRIDDLRPSAAVDGLFMAFRCAALPGLTLHVDLPPAHWYDFIWGAEVIEAGWRLGTLGVDCDHIGWGTEVGQAAALEAEWLRWCRDHGIDPQPSAMEAIRAHGAARWREFAGRFYPCAFAADWTRS